MHQNSYLIHGAAIRGESHLRSAQAVLGKSRRKTARRVVLSGVSCRKSHHVFRADNIGMQRDSSRHAARNDCRLGPRFSLWVMTRLYRGNGTIASEKGVRERKELRRISPAN